MCKKIFFKCVIFKQYFRNISNIGNFQIFIIKLSHRIPHFTLWCYSLKILHKIYSHFFGLDQTCLHEKGIKEIFFLHNLWSRSGHPLKIQTSKTRKTKWENATENCDKKTTTLRGGFCVGSVAVGSWSKFFLPGLGQFFIARVSHFWVGVGVGVGKFPLKMSIFQKNFPSGQKRSLRSASKSTRVKGGWSPFLLRVKSVLGLGKGLSLLLGRFWKIKQFVLRSNWVSF